MIASLFFLLCFTSCRALMLSSIGLDNERIMVTTKPRLAILMAGTFGNKMIGDKSTYATAFYDHMIDPLLPQFRVALMVASEPNETSAWVTWCQNFHGLSIVRIMEGAPLPARDKTRFSDALCQYQDCNKYWLQYGHLRNSYELLKKYEWKHNVHFDYIVKGRQDFMYKPDNFIKPGWFFKMASNDVAVPSTEFHMTDRWMERTPSMWPLGMCDQLVLGPRPAMDQYFNVIWNNSTSTKFSRPYVEFILADHLVSCNVHVSTVELQVSQPGGIFVNGRDGVWVTTPCELCMAV